MENKKKLLSDGAIVTQKLEKKFSRKLLISYQNAVTQKLLLVNFYINCF